MTTINTDFTTREEYLAFRDAWRTEYKALSEEIREMKRTIKREAGTDAGSYAQSKRVVLRKRANNLMQIRIAATQRSAEQRVALIAVAA